MVYSPTVVGKDVEQPQLGEGDGYTMGYLKSNNGGHIGEGWKHELEQHWDEPDKSPGYIWDSYQPKDRPQVRALFATNSCTVTRSMEDKAWTDIQNRSNLEDYFTKKYKGFDVGYGTWKWLWLLNFKQKLLDPDIADPDFEIIGLGSHMSLWVCLEDNWNSKRSFGKQKERNDKWRKICGDQNANAQSNGTTEAMYGKRQDGTHCSQFGTPGWWKGLSLIHI